MKKHSIIPIFLPELACPNRCVYCNQHNISSIQSLPSTLEINNIISKHLQTIDKSQQTCEIAFFGGSFTGLSLQDQQKYLSLTRPYIENGTVDYLRISTRPDYISKEILKQLKEYGVRIIELGAQSLDNDVLSLCGRGHTSEDVANASTMINDFGFVLGLQMMLGLPGDTAEKAYRTAETIVNLGAKASRIYPTLVIANTDLAKMYLNGEYKTLTVEKAVEQCVPIYKLFLDKGLTIYKCGLHPSDFLHNGKLLAGPWHPCFRQLVQSEIFKEKIDNIINLNKNCHQIEVNPSDSNAAFGYKKSNFIFFADKIANFKISVNKNLKRGEINAIYS